MEVHEEIGGKKKNKRSISRSPEMQALYDAVAPRIAEGENIDRLAKEFNCNRETLRYWSWRIKKRKAKQTKELITKGMNAAATVTAKDISQEVAAAVAIYTKEALVQQAAMPMQQLALLRGNVPKTLVKFDALIDSILEQLPQYITQGMVELKDATTIIGKLLSDFTDLHCLPLGRQKVEAFKQQGPARSQHLHLHTSGSRALPVTKAALDPSTGVVPPVKVIDVEVVDANELSNNQRSLLDRVK